MKDLRTHTWLFECLAFPDLGQKGSRFGPDRRKHRDVPHRATETLEAFIIDIASKNHAALAWTSVNAGWVRFVFAVIGMPQRCQLPDRKFLLLLHRTNPQLH